MKEKSRILKKAVNDQSRPVSFNDSFGGSENQFRLLLKYLADEDFKDINLILNNANHDLIEKDKIIIDSKVNGDIKAEDVITHSKSNILGNIKSKFASLGGKLKGNINSDRINIKKTANIEGVLNQKGLSIQEGAQLKIKTETSK